MAERVRQGGHDIPEPVIRRRFAAGRRNLEKLYKPAVDTWMVFDNNGATPKLQDWSHRHE